MDKKYGNVVLKMSVGVLSERQSLRRCLLPYMLLYYLLFKINIIYTSRKIKLTLVHSLRCFSLHLVFFI